MTQNNIAALKGYLNIARKAGYLIVGGEKLCDYDKKLYLVLYDKNSQKNTMKIVHKLEEKNLNCIEVENLSDIICIQNCKIAGIKNKNLSDIIYILLQG